MLSFHDPVENILENSLRKEEILVTSSFFSHVFEMYSMQGSLRNGILYFCINSLPEDKIIDSSIFKAFTIKKINLTQVEILLVRAENIM